MNSDDYQFFYDYENRLLEIKDNDDTSIVEYAYDALGRRIQKDDKIAGQKTRYYNNHDWQVLAEYDDDGVHQRSYIYGSYIDEVLVMVDPIAAEDYYYAHNHLYSPTALLDDTGAIIERYDYDAYGRPYFMEPNFVLYQTQKSNYNNPILFTGRTVDILDNGKLTLQYSRNRYLDYQTGRWLTKDPVGIIPNISYGTKFEVHNQYMSGMSLYHYLISNPVNKIDPMGLWGFCFGNWCLGDADDPWLVFWEGSGGGPSLMDMLEDYLYEKGGEVGAGTCISGGWDAPTGIPGLSISLSGSMCLKLCCIGDENDTCKEKGLKLCFSGGIGLCYGYSIPFTNDDNKMDTRPEPSHSKKGSVGASGNLENCEDEPVDICISLTGEASIGGFGCNIAFFQYCLGEGWEGDNFLSGDCSFSGFDLGAEAQLCGNVAEVGFCIFLGPLEDH